MPITPQQDIIFGSVTDSDILTRLNETYHFNLGKESIDRIRIKELGLKSVKVYLTSEKSVEIMVQVTVPAEEHLLETS
jgi:ribosomal protein L9